MKVKQSLTFIPRPHSGSDGQNAWLSELNEMGGQFWPPIGEETDMPQVGAKFPMMVYRGGENMTVYDEEDLAEAKKNGFDLHESLKHPQGGASSKPHPEPKTPDQHRENEAWQEREQERAKSSPGSESQQGFKFDKKNDDRNDPPNPTRQPEPVPPTSAPPNTEPSSPRPVGTPQQTSMSPPHSSPLSEKPKDEAKEQLQKDQAKGKDNHQQAGKDKR